MAVLEFMADQFHGGWLDGCMKFITSLGNAGFLWIVLSVTLLCFRRTRDRNGGVADHICRFGRRTAQILDTKAASVRGKSGYRADDSAAGGGLFFSVRTYGVLVCRRCGAVEKGSPLGYSGFPAGCSDWVLPDLFAGTLPVGRYRRNGIGIDLRFRRAKALEKIQIPLCPYRGKCLNVSKNPIQKKHLNR